MSAPDASGGASAARQAEEAALRKQYRLGVQIAMLGAVLADMSHDERQALLPSTFITGAQREGTVEDDAGLLIATAKALLDGRFPSPQRVRAASAATVDVINKARR